jgi:hypothetical protein
LGPSSLIWLKLTWKLDPLAWQHYDEVLERSLLERVSNFEQSCLKISNSVQQPFVQGSLIPVMIAAHFKKKLHYWVYALNNEELLENGIVLGEKGIIGRLGKREGPLYPLELLDTNSFKIALVSKPFEHPLIFTGYQGSLIGYDASGNYEIGMTLYTMPQELFYPEFFPVARVHSITETSGGREVIATLIDSPSSYDFARVYHPPKILAGA